MGNNITESPPGNPNADLLEMRVEVVLRGRVDKFVSARNAIGRLGKWIQGANDSLKDEDLIGLGHAFDLLEDAATQAMNSAIAQREPV